VKLYAYSEIESLPDGSIITWLRIPGDDTSEAVAFVRHEDDVTWISPGGWEPMSIEDAGITYPARVVSWGGDMAKWPETPPVELTQIPALEIVAATPNHRAHALECASRVYQGTRELDKLVDAARWLEYWLGKDDGPTPPADKMIELMADDMALDSSPFGFEFSTPAQHKAVAKNLVERGWHK
jgi:hypothetical protein